MCRFIFFHGLLEHDKLGNGLAEVTIVVGCSQKQLEELYMRERFDRKSNQPLLLLHIQQYKHFQCILLQRAMGGNKQFNGNVSYRGSTE